MCEVAHIGKQRISSFLPSKPVQCAVGQDPVEQHGQLCNWLVAVMLCQFHHAVLHDIQGRFFVADVINRALESSFFYAFEEVG
jgi:hypothetical protein